jgi:hypothetical protein
MLHYNPSLIFWGNIQLSYQGQFVYQSSSAHHQIQMNLDNFHCFDQDFHIHKPKYFQQRDFQLLLNVYMKYEDVNLKKKAQRHHTGIKLIVNLIHHKGQNKKRMKRSWHF